MSVAAKITPTELGAQTTARFADSFFVVKLLNSGGLAYTPGLQDPLQYVIDYELAEEFGYHPQVFGYVESDVTNYADRGVGLLQKQVIFQHDGGPTSYSFDQVSLQWASGVVLNAEASDTAVAGGLNDGNYTNVPVTSTSGSGSGLTVTFDVFSSAIVTFSIVGRGVGYDVTDTVEISEATLQSIGAHDGTGGPQGVNILDTYNPPNADSVFCIAPTANTVTLAGGNETGIYFNYKNFGYYNSSQ